ncbi:hypothetical protein Tco_1378743 [Tanacetum coccineum]
MANTPLLLNIETQRYEELEQEKTRNRFPLSVLLEIYPQNYQPLGIEELMDRKVENLSGGELQRIELCICLGKGMTLSKLKLLPDWRIGKSKKLRADVITSVLKGAPWRRQGVRHSLAVTKWTLALALGVAWEKA